MLLKVESLAIPDVKLVTPEIHRDERGYFVETFRKCDFEEQVTVFPFCQDNHVYNREAYTVRGLHFQCHPSAQAKLVRVLRGSIIDVAVDLRRSYGKESFGKHVAVELNARHALQWLYVPVGFAHGYVTLEPETEVTYKVSNYYSPKHECGLKWDDPDLGINWRVTAEDAIVSQKDQNQPLLKDLDLTKCYFV